MSMKQGAWHLWHKETSCYHTLHLRKRACYSTSNVNVGYRDVDGIENYCYCKLFDITVPRPTVLILKMLPRNTIVYHNRQ